MSVIKLPPRAPRRKCNDCVSLYHMGDQHYRCGIFKKEEMRGVVDINDPKDGVTVYQPKPCPFYSKGGTDYHR